MDILYEFEFFTRKRPSGLLPISEIPNAADRTSAFPPPTSDETVHARLPIRLVRFVLTPYQSHVAPPFDSGTDPVSRLQFTRYILAASLIGFSVVSTTVQAANITRSCDAGLSVKHSSGQRVHIEKFTGSGGCGNTVKNRCRERARDKARKCMTKHWESRWDRQRPVECRDAAGVHNYQTQDLKLKLEKTACARGWGKNASERVSLEGWTRGNSKCGSDMVLTNGYNLTPSMCATALTTPNPSPPRRPEIIIAPNDKLDPVSQLKFPSSMPPVRYPKGFNGCSANEKREIRKGWATAHYMTWIADQYMDWMAANDKYRERAWYHTHRNATAANKWINYAPRGWFGAYGRKNFDIADGTIEKLWTKRLKGTTYTVKCRTNDSNRGAHPCYQNNPGGGGKPGANHIANGTINFCNSAFTNLDPNRLRFGRMVVHELLHWMTNPQNLYIQDTHTHCHGGLRCTTDKSYGREKASHLASYEGGNRGTENSQKDRRKKHRKLALRNNDNYAWFIFYLGSRAYLKTTINGDNGLPALTRLPPAGFNWQ